MSASPLRLALYLHHRKRPKFAEFVELCRANGVEVVETDLQMDLEKNGPFDVILHKITDDLSEEVPSQASRERIQCLQQYCNDHPNVPIVDPIESLTKILDRSVMYGVLGNLKLPEKFEGKVRCPEFVTASDGYEQAISLVRESGMEPPYMCKTVRACGTEASHIMSVVKSIEDISNCQVGIPMCVSRYINHGATLWKVYVLDQYIQAVSRESTADVKPEDPSVVKFDSQKLSKQSISPPDGREAPPRELLEAIANGIRQALGVTLFGFDLIRQDDSTFHVIDVNYFPTYDGVPNMHRMLLDYIVSRAKSQQ